MFSSCVISFQISHRTRQFKNKLSCTNWTPIMKYGLRTHTHTCDSWMHRRQKGVSAATNTERFRISWHTSHIITFTAFSQWLSPFRNICGHLSCGAASIMLRSKATILTVNLVCVCCSSSVLGFFFFKKKPFIASTLVQIPVKTWKYWASDGWRRFRVSSATTNQLNHVSSRCYIW